MKLEITNKKLYSKMLLAANNADIGVDQFVEEALSYYLNYLKLEESTSIRYRNLSPENKIYKGNSFLAKELDSAKAIFNDIEDSAEYVSIKRKQ